MQKILVQVKSKKGIDYGESFYGYGRTLEMSENDAKDYFKNGKVTPLQFIASDAFVEKRHGA